MDSLDSGDAAGFARLSQDLLAQATAENTWQAIVEHAVQTISGCDYAGITMAGEDQVESSAATGPLVRLLDQAQYDLREGPCLSTTVTDEMYLINDTRTEQRWPRWCPVAAGAGVLSVLSVQITELGHVRAALNLYSPSAAAYDDDAVVTAQIYALHASNAITATSESENLSTAMRTRHRIGMAQGMLMLRYGLDEEKAFQFLRRQSQDGNVKLREIADRVVADVGKLRWPVDQP